jgi:hypothetical protein
LGIEKPRKRTFADMGSQAELGNQYALPHQRQANALLDAAMPLLSGVDPKRMEAVKPALVRLSMLQQERVVLMMPEIQFRGV